MKKIKAAFILAVICSSLFINVHGIIAIDEPGPRPTGICPIETTIVNP